MANLKTLIKVLEKEKASLQQLINEAVYEQEFLSAHFHFEALRQTNKQLHTLKNLDDDLYDKKYFLEAGIENLKKLLENEPEDNVKTVLSQFIADKETELAELHQIPKKQKNTNTQHHLRTYLEQLIQGNVRGLRLILSKTDNLRLDLKRTAAGITLTMPAVKKLEAKFLLTEERFSKLKGLGFFISESGDEVTTTLSDDSNLMTDRIMRLLSIIVFDVFYFKEFGGDPAIEIFNKQIGDNDKQ